MTRHRWVKLKLYNYICNRCGTGKRNAQHENGDWFATFHRATGEVIVSAHVPACEQGKLTEERLGWLQQKIEAAQKESPI